MSARLPTALDARIGRLIRQRRLELGLRQEDLARALSVAPHQLQKYEVGENRISASRLVDCAQALKVPVAWFYQSAESQNAKSPDTRPLVDEEQGLLDAYRSLDARSRTQLIGIAKLMQGEQSLGRKKSKPS